MQNVNAELNTTPSNANTPSGAERPGADSVAYGNIPAPGLVKFERASQESLRIVCGCLAEWVAVQANMMKFKEITKNGKRERGRSEKGAKVMQK